MTAVIVPSLLVVLSAATEDVSVVFVVPVVQETTTLAELRIQLPTLAPFASVVLQVLVPAESRAVAQQVLAPAESVEQK